MKRTIKMFGVCALSVFALSAVSASGSWAATFQATAYPAKVIAKNTNNHVFTAGLVGSISCTEATFTGKEFLKGPVSVLTVIPVYKKCTFLTVETTVNMNGCVYEFLEPEGTAPTFKGKVNVVCPTGKVITFSAGACTVEVPGTATENHELSSVTYTNKETSPKTVEVVANVTGITYISSLGCNGTPGKHSDGVYEGTATASAVNELGGTVGAFIG